MIKFNVPYTSERQIDEFKELVNNNKYAGGGSYSDKIKKFMNDNYLFNDIYLTTNCTSAIQLCSMAIEFNAGDEIIIPSFTFSSTPTPFLLKGCKIILADCCEEYPNISLKTIKDKITPNTKAVMVVHYGGYHKEIEEIKNFCTQNNLILIEDAAQAIHSFNNGKALGSYGDFSVFSFHETKNITCGEGGMLVVNNKKYINKIEKIYQCGTNRTEFLDGKVKNYEWVAQGLSFTLSEISSAFLYAQLLDIKQVTAKRQLLWEAYFNNLSEPSKNERIKLPQINLKSTNFHTFFICLNCTETLNLLATFMKKNRVQCATHYYPLHMSIYAKEHFPENQPLINTEYYGTCLLRLPLHYDLSVKDVQYVSSLICKFFE